MDSFLSSKASSFFSNKTDETDDSQPENKKENEKPHTQSSNSDLLSSAQLVAEAAKSGFGGEFDKVDKGKVAGAGADLLDAASKYGNLEEKSFGTYVEKAEDYLHNYHSSHSTTTTTTTTTTTNYEHSATGPTTTTDSGKLDTETSAPATTESPAKSGDGDSESGGYGGYLKMAEGFLKK